MTGLARRILPLAGLGLAAFIGFSLALTPARLAFDLAGRPAGVEAGLVTGTVWDADLRRVRAGGMAIEAIEAKLAPLPLLTGRAVIDFTVADSALRGSGRLIVKPDERVLEAASGVLGLDSAPALSAADLPAGQSARIEIERLVLSPSGACREARGRVTSAALVAAGRRYDAELPALNAALACAGDAVALNFSGAAQALELSGQIRLSPTGPQWRIMAETADRDMIAALSLMGFSQEGDRFIAESAP